jgi:hypothetical protein
MQKRILSFWSYNDKYYCRLHVRRGIVRYL